jgi:hypothetical protein
MNRSSNNRGFALPMAIFVIAFATMSLAAAFTIISSERRVLDNTKSQVSAEEIAQSGLSSYLVNRASYGFVSSPPAASESTRVTTTGGYADVVSTQLRPAVGTVAAIYVVRSRGTSTAATLDHTPTAQRTVATITRYQPGLMTVKAGWLSLTGLQKNGNSGTISGVDHCGAKATVAGAAVATRIYHGVSGGGYNASGGYVPTGVPPVDTLGDDSRAKDSVNIDWAGISAGTSITPDVIIPPGSWPASFPANYYPVILVRGDFALPGSGQGTLIVTGSFTISGAVSWNGIIMVGNDMTSNGNNTVYGATLTGLNVKTATNPDSAASVLGTDATGNGTKTYQYDSCQVSKAMAKYGALQMYRNAWFDNWASY